MVCVVKPRHETAVLMEDVPHAPEEGFAEAQR